MRKIIGFITGILIIAFQGCTTDEHYTTVVNNTENPVLEITTNFSALNDFTSLVTINPPIKSADLILVYQLYDVFEGNDIWRLLPQTYYFAENGQLDYNYDFTINDVKIFMEANFDMTTLPPVWTDNQIFRIVILPGYFSSKSAKNVDFNDYETTIKVYGINPNNIKDVKL